MTWIVEIKRGKVQIWKLEEKTDCDYSDVLKLQKKKTLPLEPFDEEISIINTSR